MAARSTEPPDLQAIDETPHCVRNRASRKRAAVLTSPTPKRPRVDTLRTPTPKKRRTLFVTSPRESPTVTAARKILAKSLLRTPQKPQKSSKWTDVEKAAFVEFLALKHLDDPDTTDQIWPACGVKNTLWDEAAEFVALKLRTPKRNASAMRSMCTKEFSKFATFEEAEKVYGVDYYASPKVKAPVESTKITTPTKSTPQQLDTREEVQTPNAEEPQTLKASLLALDLPDLLANLDNLFVQACRKNGLKLADRNFISNSYRAMEILQEKKKPNVLSSFAEVIAEEKIPMDRMPWGLIEYQIQFFKSSHINQIKNSIPEDLLQWVESLCSQGKGSTVHLRLLRGPMWSGYERKDVGKISLKKALESLPKDGRYWIKLDGTDLKPGIKESVEGVWSGDTDLGDGKLQKLRAEYDKRVSQLTTAGDKEGVQILLQELKEDLLLLGTGVGQSGERYRVKKTQNNVNQETLKAHAWDYIEFQELLRLAHVFSSGLSDVIDANTATVKAYLQDNRADLRDYLKNLFKKKRTAATHILVLMVSDEHRIRKPYSVPVQYIPYNTLKDQFLRDLLVNLKETMTQLGLKVEGVVTDGEFHTLRTRGNTRSLHLWQIVHDARDAVRKTSSKVLAGMLTPVAVDVNTGAITAQISSEAIPQEVLRRVAVLLEEGNSFEEAVDIIRLSLVPEGYTPHPFRPDMPENMTDKLRSIVATYVYRKTVADYHQDGVDFRTYLYIPEVDATTGEMIHERSDHNHLLKRIATSTREGKNQKLGLQYFDDAVRSKTSGLTHAALVGLRKQSVPDAERLLSHRMARFMATREHEEEAKYIKHIARWHEASDGRGLCQRERSKANYDFLNYILDEWMPWHRELYDFSTIDVNRQTTNIRGLTYQTLIEVTCNIESQELRRRQNSERGYAEHPRAGTTDDNEGFFSLARRQLGNTFILKDFAAAFPKIVREFVRKLDDDLPFYYYVLDERFHRNEPSFDQSTSENVDHQYQIDGRAERLHREMRNTREDSSIIGGGRCFLPPHGGRALRTRLFNDEEQLPPVPPNLLL